MALNSEILTSNTTVIYGDANTPAVTSIAIDYTVLLSDIALSLRSISNNIVSLTSVIQNASDVSANNSNTLINILSQISSDSATMAGLASGVSGFGIRVVTPWEWISIAPIIKLYEKQGIDLSELKNLVESIQTLD